MFKFKLQKALEVKEREEEEKRKELSDRRSILYRELGKLTSIEEEICKTITSYSESKKGVLDIALMNSFERYLSRLKKDKIEQNSIVEMVQKKVEEAERFFLECRKERKIFEKLKEKSYEKFIDEELKNEQKFIDELSNSMFNRRR